jgi:hypothetical protein
MKSCIKFLGILFSTAAVVCLLPSCVTTPEKKHVYDFGEDGDEVTQLPHSRPESFEGNPFGNMPQSR